MPASGEALRPVLGDHSLSRKERHPMNYEFAVKWLKAFRSSSDEVCALYADDFLFEDPMLDQQGITDKGDLHRLFDLYANKDRTNGFGVHNFLIRWEWFPEDCAVFLGLDVAGKPFGTQGHTWHEYNADGKIVRESSWWDASAILRTVGPVHPGKIPTGESAAVAA
jgi:steroid delta-isomerase-like uncharacterized protein